MQYIVTGCELFDVQIQMGNNHLWNMQRISSQPGRYSMGLSMLLYDLVNVSLRSVLVIGAVTQSNQMGTNTLHVAK